MSGDLHFVFLICTERSGSNFITSLMNGHSRICGPPPSHLFRLFGTNRANYGDLTCESNWQILVHDVAANFQCKLGTWSTAATAEELAEGAGRRCAAELLRALYEKEAEHDGASHLFVKENQTFSFAPFLLSHFPGCRFVWMVRDPRDVASSWILTPGIPGGVGRAVEVWTKDQEGARALYHQMRDSGRILFMRYEELVQDTTRVLRGLTSFLALPYEERMLNFFNERRTALNAERIDAWANLRRPVLRGNTGKYHRVLSQADRRYVELACGKLMAELGYPCELVTDEGDAATRAAELEALRPSIHPGERVRPSAEEQAIRDRRLAAIERVLARKL